MTTKKQIKNEFLYSDEHYKLYEDQNPYSFDKIHLNRKSGSGEMYKAIGY